MRINGKPEYSINAADRGLQYGDGLFETIAAIGGKPCLWERHLRRLRSGCRRLGIECPSPDRILSECLKEIAGRERGVLKLLLTRGAGGRGYRPPAATEPTCIVACHAWPDYPSRWWRDGIRLRFCSTPLGENPVLAGIKHLNRLEQVLAQAEWNDPEIAEGLMLDTGGRVVEGTMSNLFLIRDETLLTPDLSRCGVAGVMQGLVLDLAREQGICVQERVIVPADLDTADALFVTNSLIGLWPVQELEGRRYGVDAIPAPLRHAVEQFAWEPSGLDNGLHSG